MLHLSFFKFKMSHANLNELEKSYKRMTKNKGEDKNTSLAVRMYIFILQLLYYFNFSV